MQTICSAIRSNGVQCDAKRKATLGDGTKCGTHHNSIIKFGPHTFARRELGYKHKKEYNEFIDNYRVQRREAIERNENQDVILTIDENYHADLRVMRARQGRIAADLLVIQRTEIRNSGVDPDAPARERQRADAARRALVWRQRLMEQQLQREALLQNAINNAFREPVRHVPVGREPVGRQLAAFAADPQNVHTTEAVKQTKDIVELVRKIPVPDGYRWNTRVVSKTIGEIIAECQLTAHAAAQMFNQYVSTVSIYDIEEGIYGKVLDSVWQYVKASPDKEDLCRILKNEMTDNVGMCAQGNLSRICNILAGYMEGIGAQESLSERLGRLLPPLMALEDVTERIRQACVILSENKVPQSDWDIWMEPFIEEEFTEFYTMIREQLVA